MSPRPPIKAVWLDAFANFRRMWVLGWLMAGKFLLAAVVLLSGYVLVGFFSQFERLLPRDAPWVPALRIVASIFVLGVYLPLTVYVAASWVGFCPRIDRADPTA